MDKPMPEGSAVFLSPRHGTPGAGTTTQNPPPETFQTPMHCAGFATPELGIELADLTP
jgi:hypothetical protein